VYEDKLPTMGINLLTSVTLDYGFDLMIEIFDI